jgi:uncharacterized phage protein gp47/JayE
MPVPDLTPYVDLTLDDRTTQDLFDGFLADALSRAPEWDPLEVSPAVIYAQSILVAASELLFAVNRLPGALLEALGRRGYQLPRGTGVAAAATMTFIVADTDGHVLPAGTRVALDVDGELVTFTTDVDAAVAAGNDTGVVAITADDVGTAANGVAAGAPVQVIDSIAFLDEASLATAVAGGLEPEASEDYLTRLAARLQRQTLVLTVASQFEFAALEVPGVSRALGIDRYDPATGPTPGDNLGHVTVALADVAGVAVTPAVRADVAAAIGPATQGGLITHLIDPTITAVPVTMTVHRDGTLDDAGAAAAVTAALEAYLSPATWPWAGTVFVNELEHVARSVPGIDRVVVTTVPAADEALPGDAPLASAGAIVVNVVSG